MINKGFLSETITISHHKVFKQNALILVWMISRVPDEVKKWLTVQICEILQGLFAIDQRTTTDCTLILLFKRQKKFYSW